MQSQTDMLRHIKTDLSEVDKDYKSVKIQEKCSATKTYNTNDPRYICSICQTIRIKCPCPLTHQSRTSFEHHQAGNKIRLDKYQNSLNRTTVHQTSSSVPKITFTYAGAQEFRHRRNSLNTPNPPNLNNQTMYLKSVTTKTVIHPIEQIIYYPVVHNRLKFQTPEKLKQSNANKQSSKKRASMKRSYLGYSHKRAQDISTKETKEPMTPQQFRKMTDWLLMEK